MPIRFHAVLACVAVLACTFYATAEIELLPGVEYELAGSEPRRIIAAGLNEDSSLDVIVSMSADGEVAFRFGDGSGVLPDDDSLQTQFSSWGLAVADIDGDGDQDFVTGDGNGESSMLKSYLNDGSGGFSLFQTFGTGNFPVGIVADDFNGDGHPDLAVACNTGGVVAVYFNDGTGVYVYQGVVAGLNSIDATDIACGDIDSDGDIDLAVSHYDGVRTCLNDGGGAFTAGASVGYSPGTTQAVDLGDVDGDGNLDVVSCQIYSGRIALRLGNGDGSFGLVILLSAGASANDVMIVDLNNDERGDIVGINQSSDTVYLFESIGGGVFATPVTYASGLQPTVGAAGDFDHDGVRDLAVACRNLADTASLFLFENISDTSVCVEVLQQPEAELRLWTGHVAVFESQIVAAPPLSYRWHRDGVPVFDGVSSGGSLFSGADTATLVIRDVVESDAGVYTLEVTAGCGTMSTMPSVLVVQTPPALPTSWNAVSLHPAGTRSSSGMAIDEFGAYGSYNLLNEEIGVYVDHPFMWAGPGHTPVDLTPAGSAGGAVRGAAGGVQVGWWWWPYTCRVSGQTQTCYTRQAAIWMGSAGSHLNRQVSGWEYSTIGGTDGIEHVGTKSTDDAVGNTFAHALLWPSSHATPIDLHPPSTVASKSYGAAADGGKQYGTYNTPYPGPIVKAAMWRGSAASFVDMNPPNATSSSIGCAGDGQQGGRATIDGVPRNGIWADSPLSFLELTPGCDTSCSINACLSGLQAGVSVGEATLWASSPSISTSLHVALTPEYSSSSANALYIDDAGVLHVIGTAYNAVAGRNEAVLWSSVSDPAGAADLTGDGVVDASDLAALLAAWGTAGTTDLNSDGVTDAADLAVLLAAWG